MIPILPYGGWSPLPPPRLEPLVPAVGPLTHPARTLGRTGPTRDCMDRLLDLPLPTAIALLWCVAMLRANATYWVGRGLIAGGRHTGLQQRLDGPAIRRGERLVARWGVLAVPLSFLTIGVQTAVNAAAGVARMPLRRYLPAVAVGALAWALLYATVGLAAVLTALGVAAGSPWAVGVLVAVLVAAAVVLLVRHSRRGPAQDCPVVGLPDDGPAESAAASSRSR